jgi:hypothetical protein
MGWAEDRMKDYRRGQRATWLERRALEHANPVHLALALMASAGFAFGLWTHNWVAIAAAGVVALLGRVYCWMCKPAINSLETDGPENFASARQRTNRYVDASGKYRAGSLVRALSWYGGSGRARRAAKDREHREREAS